MWEVFKAVYKTLDAAEKGANKCADALREILPEESKITASDVLRSVMYQLTQKGPAPRTLIPALFYRMQRCADKDVEALAYLLDSVWRTESDFIPDNSTSTAYANSDIVTGIILFSELWTSSIDYAELSSRLLAPAFKPDARVCAFNSDTTSKYCKALSEDEKKVIEQIPAFLPEYVPEEWVSEADDTEESSILFFSGDLDFGSPYPLAEAQYKEMEGAKKLFVEVDAGGYLPATSSDDDSQCGYQIIASFVNNDGDVSQVDTSCLDSLPAINYHDADIAKEYFNTNDPFDA